MKSGVMLKRARRTKILLEGNPELLHRFAACIEQKYNPRILRHPEKSLVMSQAKDSIEQRPFYLGEILITECTVTLDQVHGFGAVIGDRGDTAYRLAVIDAAFRTHVPEVEEWEPLLQEEEERIHLRHREEQSRITRTRVQFDTMEGSRA
jgi:alpha-D-ribose 1-methylphosphonate 5-triphosphate synthase subunit PhnG